MPIKRKSYRKRRTTKRPSRRRHFARRSRGQVPTNPAGFRTLFNRGREQIHRVSTTDYAANTISGAAGAVSEVGIIDPSGTNSTHGSMPEWTTWTAVYSLYRLKKIIMTFTLTTLEGTDNAILPEMFIRWNYHFNQTAPGTADLQEQRNWTKIAFGAGNQRCFTYTIYPKVAQLTYYDTALETADGQGMRMVKQGWTDVTQPAQMYGYMFYIPNLATGMAIRHDIQYLCEFKEQY